MKRREIVLAAALAAGFGAGGVSARAQDINVGLIVPLSAPGDATPSAKLKTGDK